MKEQQNLSSRDYVLREEKVLKDAVLKGASEVGVKMTFLTKAITDLPEREFEKVLDMRLTHMKSYWFWLAQIVRTAQEVQP